MYLLYELELHSDDATKDVYYDSTEVAEPVPEFDVVECKESEISLNAISGSLGAKSLRLLGFILHHRVSILVDSRSTHNFLNPALLSKVQLQVTPTPLLHVKIANKTSIQSCGQVTSISLRIQSHSIVTNFYLIFLGGCDIVLGVGWLIILGPIQWDFSHTTMQCMWLGHSTTLRGVTPAELSLEDGPHFLKSSSSDTKGILLKLLSCTDG
jgi:hypothetical protein